MQTNAFPRRCLFWLALFALALMNWQTAQADITIENTFAGPSASAGVSGRKAGDPGDFHSDQPLVDTTWRTTYHKHVSTSATLNGGSASANGDLDANLAVSGDQLQYSSSISSVQAIFSPNNCCPDNSGSGATFIAETRVQFIVTQRSQFSLSGSISAGGNSDASLVFVGGPDTFRVREDLVLNQSDPSRTLDIAKGGIIEPGLYTVRLQGDTGADSTTSANSVAGDISLIISPIATKIFHWTNPAGGSFQDRGNWNPQSVPTQGTTAIFDLSGQYNVNVGTQRTDRLLILDGEVTFTNSAYTVDTSASVDSSLLKLASGRITSASLFIGDFTPSTVKLDPLTAWIIGGPLTVGGGIAPGFLFTNGLVMSDQAQIGSGTGDGFVEVKAGGEWTSGKLDVGVNSQGSLLIDEGARVTSLDSTVGGNDPGSIGTTVLVQNVDRNGARSTWDLGDHKLSIGPGGGFGIRSGGLLTVGLLSVESSNPNVQSHFDIRGLATSGSVPIFSQVDAAHGTFISGTAVALIAEGGFLSTKGLTIFGRVGFDSLTISGVASSIAAPAGSSVLDVEGRTIVDGTFIVEAGARSHHGSNEFAIGVTTAGNVTVRGFDAATGEFSFLDLISDLTIGFGEQGTLTIENGAAVICQNGTIGSTPGSSGTVVVQGPGKQFNSFWTNEDTLIVGDQGKGNLTLKDGGTASARSSVFIGVNAGSEGVVSVTGRSGNQSSQLLTQGSISLGFAGVGNLEVTGGGSVKVGADLTVGGVTPSTTRILVGGIDLPSGTPATIEVTGSLSVSTGEVDIIEDGDLHCGDAVVGDLPGSDAVVHVGNINGTPGTPARFTMSGNLTVGDRATGTLVLQNQAVVSAGGAILVGGGGLIAGTGTLSAPTRVVTNGGIIQPGLSPGTLTIDANFVQKSSGLLKMEVAGLEAGKFDVLHVTGTATLDGTMQVMFLNGYLPKRGDAVPLLEVDGTVTGDFAHIVFPQLASGFQIKTEMVNGKYQLTALNDAVRLFRKELFRGLLAGDPASHEVAGFFTIHTTAAGGFSARFVLGGRSFALSGKFDSAGKFSKTIPRQGDTPLTINLELAVIDGARVITGAIVDGDRSIPISADQAKAFNAKTNPAPQAGKYTALLQFDSAASDTPQANGIGVVGISTSGAIRFVGALADGTRLSQGTVLSKSGEWPLYVLLYKKQGSLFGELQFREKAGSDFEGMLQWSRPPTPNDKIQTAGFFATLLTIGSKYVAPPARPAVLDLPKGATATLSDADLTPALTKSLMLSPPNKFVVLDPGADKLSLSASATNGLLSGRFIHPKTGVSTEVHGVVFQKQNLGSGFFLRPSVIGSFEMLANP